MVPEFIQRVMEEDVEVNNFQNKLRERSSKLFKFLQDKDKTANLSEESVKLLHRQFDSMVLIINGIDRYKDILEERLKVSLNEN